MLNTLLSKWDNIRIKKKLFLSFVVVAFIPIIIVGLFLTSQFRNHVLDQAMEQSNSNVVRIASQLENLIERPIEISRIIMSDSKLSNVINTQYETTYEVVKTYREFEDFRNYLRLYSEINNIKFYSSNITMLENWEFFQINENAVNQDWYKKTDQSGKIYWAFAEDETKGNLSFLTLARKVEFPAYRTSGTLLINISRDELNNIIQQETFDTYIFDSNGVIVAAKNTSYVGMKLDQLELGNFDSIVQPGKYEIMINEEPSRIIVEEVIPVDSQNGLYIMSIFSIDSIVSGANQISYQGLLIIMLSLVIALILIYMSSALISKRLLMLNRNINQAGRGDLSVISNISGTDEIGLLSRQFNNMVSNIRELMDKVRETEQQRSQMEIGQREIKLKMMASQINPHFLFNALESIRMNAHMKGDKEIADIVKMLGKMIRKNLEVGTGFVTLADELEVVRCYLIIQRFRFGDERLAFTFDVDEEVLDIHIPPLLIQPIVENAIIHGIDQLLIDGYVRVSVKKDGNKLNICVSDNGHGMSEDRLREVTDAIAQETDQENARIGLRNVHQRLVMIYGEQSGLKISSTESEGTSISFVIGLEGIKHV